ncbi:MAG TPA: hypothetical protein VNU46_03230 [Gemmatimonadaceae bacterium]|jgi:hypothetical protein|nr:hypothetical protein [Gemmatimonadaceae bacterium]
MITKDQLAASMLRECDIIQHLFTKLGPDALTYRPSPAQRTTLELLRYLSICGTAGIRCMSEANWKLFSGFAERAKEMTAEEFPAAMQRQSEEIAAFFASVSEETLETQEAPLPGGTMLPLGLAILNGPFKWLASYKLQLFLYAKAAGAVEIGTANAWAGADRR